MTFRNTLFTALALGFTLSAPLAFAQQAPTSATPAPAAAAQDPATAATQADPAATQPAAQQPAAQPAAPAGEPKKVTWADLDVDKDGKLNKTEVASVQALTQVFDDADADKDGALTPDEYKAYVAKGQQQPQPAQGEG